MRFTASLVTLALAATATTYFKDTFDTLDNWSPSEVAKFDGKFELSSGAFFGDEKADQGLKTTADAKFYAIGANFDKFDTTGKDLVVQFSVKHEQKIDCGGGYIKLFPEGLNPKELDDESKETYSVMFGPDICGNTKKVHVIFSYKGKQLLTKHNIPCKTDELTHVYTLIVRPDLTYEVRVDGEKVHSEKLEVDFDFLAPKEIQDPEQSKPEDWVDEAMMDDPEDKKPEGWDDIPAVIPDPEAEKPEDWDDEADGEWEAPTIDNPLFKGEWSPKRIENPDYKGPWVHPMIPNPEYAEDPNMAFYEIAGAVFDLWQVKSGTIFDNLIITDSVEEAEALLAETYTKNKDAEKSAFDALEAKRKEEEEAARKAAEEAEAKEEEEEEEEDEEDDDEEEDTETHDEL